MSVMVRSERPRAGSMEISTSGVDSLEIDPHLWKLRGQDVVIKYGGAAMNRPRLRDLFSRDIAILRSAGIKPVVVHGGGPQISRLMADAGKTPCFVEGMRVTDDETMGLVERALLQINQEIALLIKRHGARAQGLSSPDSNLVRACQRQHLLPSGEAVDLGRVGDVESVNTKPIRALQAHGVVPVIAPFGIGPDRRTYNINADLVAGEVAAVLGAAKLIFLTDVRGVLDQDGCRFRRLSRWAADSLVQEDALAGGMLPKVEGAVRGLKGGAAEAHIIDGRIPHALLLSLRERHGLGTEVIL